MKKKLGSYEERYVKITILCNSSMVLKYNKSKDGLSITHNRPLCENMENFFVSEPPLQSQLYCS